MKRKAAYAALVPVVFVLVFATVTLADDNGAKGPVIPQLTPSPTKRHRRSKAARDLFEVEFWQGDRHPIRGAPAPQRRTPQRRTPTADK